MKRPSSEKITSLDRQFHARLALEVKARYGKYVGRALDMFARDGAMSISNYPDWSWEAWELDGQHEAALKALGCEKIIIGDTYETIGKMFENRSLSMFLPSYRMIWVDGPQGLFPDSKGKLHSEHFDLLPQAIDLIDIEGGLLVLYVNKQPYDKRKEGDFGIDSYKEYDFIRWMMIRKEFYRNEEVVDEAQALFCYQNAVFQAGRKVKSMMMWPSIDDLPGMPPSFRLVMEIV